MKWRVRKPGAKDVLFARRIRKRFHLTKEWHRWFAWWPVRVPTHGRMSGNTKDELELQLKDMEGEFRCCVVGLGKAKQANTDLRTENAKLRKLLEDRDEAKDQASKLGGELVSTQDALAKRKEQLADALATIRLYARELSILANLHAVSRMDVAKVLGCGDGICGMMPVRRDDNAEPDE